MPKTIYQLRLPHVRLLASMLVIIAILCNGIGLAQAHVMDVKKDCCPEMNMEAMASEAMSGDVDACSNANSDCDDLCMERCMSDNGLLSVALTISPSLLITTPLPQLNISEHALAEFGPGLRPPIYS